MRSFELSLVNAELPSLQPSEVAIFESGHRRKPAGHFAFRINRMPWEDASCLGGGQKDASCDHLNVMAFISADRLSRQSKAAGHEPGRLACR
jgi:hypothetical protein